MTGDKCPNSDLAISHLLDGSGPLVMHQTALFRCKAVKAETAQRTWDSSPRWRKPCAILSEDYLMHCVVYNGTCVIRGIGSMVLAHYVVC